MRMLRTMVVSRERSQVFHVISRVVDQNKIFEEEEKGKFLGFMRQFEAFSGVEVLSYCLMGNHFHLLIHVPKKPEHIPDEEVRNRMLILYGEKKMAEIDEQIAEKRNLGDENFEKELYDSLRGRMYDLSHFVRDLKLRFSKWYNGENDRKGTLWEDRFRSVLVEPSEDAMMRVAAYIELNSVRAGIVSQPHEYRWCSFTEAVAGGRKSRDGISQIVGGLDSSMNWDKAARIYRSYFLHKAAAQNHEKSGLSAEEYHEEMKNGGDLSENEQMRTRLRYFTEGAVLGSQQFLKDFLVENRDKIGAHRKTAGFKMGGGETSLFSYRKVE